MTAATNSPSRIAQQNFEQRYGAWLIDDQGREVPIDPERVAACLDDISGSDDEFICYLARRQAG